MFRQVVFIILLLPSIKNNLPQLLKPQRVGVHLSRVTGAFIALYFGFVAVSHLPLADATALGFLQVLFVAVMSKALLSEKLDRLRMSTIALGFVGVIMVVQPSFSQASSYYVSLGVLSAFGAAIAVICVRTLSQNQPKVVLLSYQAFFVGLVALIPSILSWQTPTLFELTLLVLIGVTSSLAQWIGVSATNRPCQHRRQCRVLKNAILHPIRLLAV
ncbi:metabolite transporter (DMT) superfamily [Vibrio astriarenae]|nr:metabolite transporter (DMT) superfamily [Vibrio sp. C7]